MLNKAKQSLSDDIDLKELFLSLWKNKILYLFIILLCSISGFFYSKTFNKNLELISSIIVKEHAIDFFSSYKPFFDDVKIKFPEEEFKENFHRNIMSMDNLQKFVDQNTEIDEFKLFLQKKQLTSKEYFKSRLNRKTIIEDARTIQTNNYNLQYNEILDGNKFFNEYVIFSKNIAIETFKNFKKIKLKSHIQLLEQNLEIAKEINLENPIIQDYEGNIQSSILVEPSDIYYNGTKVLAKRIEHLNGLIKKFENGLDYNPILDSSYTIGSNKKNVNYYPIIGLLVGLALSFIIALIRNIKK